MRAIFFTFYVISVINCAIVDFVRLFDGSNSDLINGKPNGKECEEWITRHVTNNTKDQSDLTKDTKFLATCFDPKVVRPQCYLELPQFRPPKNVKISNLIFTIEYTPDDQLCTGRCGLESSILVYRTGMRPVQYKLPIQGYSPGNKVTKVYQVENSELVNALFFRITPVDFCGKIQNVRLFVGKELCSAGISKLVKFPSFVKTDENISNFEVNGQCVKNAVTKQPNQTPSAICDAGSGNYTLNSGGCVCKEGHEEKDSTCQACEKYYFKSITGNQPCTKCGNNSKSVWNYTRCDCLLGYHRTGNVAESGDPNKQDCIKRITGFCRAESMNYSGNVYRFPNTPPGQISYLPCGVNNPNGVVERKCVLSRVAQSPIWEKPTWSSCVGKEPLANTIEDLSKVQVLENNTVVVSRTLTNLTSNFASFQSSQDVPRVINIMRACLDTQTGQNKEVVENVLFSLGNVLELNQTQLSSVSNKEVLLVLDTVAKNSLDYPVSFSGKTFTYSTYNTLGRRDLQAVIEAESCYSELNINFINQTTVASDNKLSKMAEVFVPQSVLKDQNITSAKMVVYAFKDDGVFPYKDDGVFPKTQNNMVDKVVKHQLSSIIVATSIFNRTIKNTRENIQITFKISSMDEARKAICMYWQFDKDSDNPGYWSSSGCYKSNFITTEMNEIYVVCSCSHLTNFALLFNVHNVKTAALKSHRALKLVNFIGCIVSMISLIATLVCYLGLRDIRRRTARKILINFCFSLLFLLTTFIFGIEQTMHPRVCHVTSALIHVFTLSTFAWMSVHAIFLYKKTVRATQNRGEKTTVYRISFFVAWGLPTAVAGTTYYFTIPQFQNNAIENHFCVINRTISNYVILVPVSFCILFNWSVFIPVVRTIQKQMSKRAHLQKDARISLWRRVKITLSCATLLGITWVFGYLAIGDAREIFQWLFCVANSLQGLFIFIFYVLLNEALIKAWKKAIFPNSRSTSNSSEQSRSLMFPWKFSVRSGAMTYSVKERQNSITGNGNSAILIACKNKQKTDDLK